MEQTRPKHEVVTVPQDQVIEIECVKVPIETPSGVIDGSAMEVRFSDKRYQILTIELGVVHSILHEAIDVETGEIVCLRFPGTF